MIRLLTLPTAKGAEVRPYAASQVAALGLLVATGCGGTPPVDVGGDVPRSHAGGESATSSSCGLSPDALPPTPACTQAAPDAAGHVTFALKKLFLGDTDWDGTADKTNGWKELGFNLDGQTTTAGSNATCRPVSGGSVEPDGMGGIDNSFGHNIAPFLENLGVGSSTINDAIAAGTFTVMLDIDGLGSGASVGPLITRLYAGKGATPPLKWDGTDAWPVVPELLSNPSDLTSTMVTFPQSYTTKNVWVSGPRSDVTLVMAVSGISLNLTIRDAVLSMTLDPTHKAGTHGVIAGALETAALTRELAKIVGFVSPAFCPGSPAVSALLNRIGQASDLLLSGAADATKTCDAISIGVGFEAAPVTLGPVAAPAEQQPDPCQPSP